MKGKAKKKAARAVERKEATKKGISSAKSLIGYDSMMSTGAAYLGNDLWSITLKISSSSSHHPRTRMVLLPLFFFTP